MDGDLRFDPDVSPDANKVFHQELDSCAMFHDSHMGKALKRAIEIHLLAQYKWSSGEVILKNHHLR